MNAKITTLPILLPLLAASCGSLGHGPEEQFQGTLYSGSAVNSSASGRDNQSVRLIGQDLQLRSGSITATVREATAGGSIDFQRTDSSWDFELPAGEARWEGRTLRIGKSTYELEPGGTLILDSQGQRIAGEPALLHHQIGTIHRDVTTDSAEAQLWFDRGLALCFGFNHEEAVPAFDRAIQADPSCAMAYWGKAYALGPNYNNAGPDPAACAAAIEALTAAQAALNNESPSERALIAASTLRFSSAADTDRAALDLAYADAMRAAYTDFPDDRDICALTAEAVMQLRPWGLWTPEGEAAPETPEIRRLIEGGLERWPNHPALCHLYIHAMEAGPEVQLAIPAAERLEGIAPGLGHLIHMPSHAYVWTGRYDDVIRTNVEAVAVDDDFAATRGKGNFYTAYRIHNYHFVAYGAMWEGRRALALEYARRIPEQIPAGLMANAADVFDVFHATPYHVMVRFGMWDELVNEEDPEEGLPATRAVWRYARALAYAALGRVEEAEREQIAFEQARDLVPSSRALFNNPVSEILAIATEFLEGEIEYRKGNYDAAFGSLRKAVALDEKLNYDEPWGWMEPTRHALGALLTEQGRYTEAIEVYLKNLERYPDNGWALHGLAECQTALGMHAEAELARKRFEKAWARADVVIPGSCFCKTE